MTISSVSSPAYFSALYRVKPTDNYWLNKAPKRVPYAELFSQSQKKPFFSWESIQRLWGGGRKKTTDASQSTLNEKLWTAQDARLSVTKWVDGNQQYIGQQVFADDIAKRLGFKKAGLNQYRDGSHPVMIGYRNPVGNAQVFIAVNPDDKVSLAKVKAALSKTGMVFSTVNEQGRSGQVLTVNSEYVQGKENHPYKTYVPQVAVAEVDKIQQHNKTEGRVTVNLFDEDTGQGHWPLSHQSYDVYDYFTESYLKNEEEKGYDNDWVTKGMVYTNPLHENFSQYDTDTILARILRFALDIKDEQVTYRSLGEKLGRRA